VKTHLFSQFLQDKSFFVVRKYEAYYTLLADAK